MSCYDIQEEIRKLRQIGNQVTLYIRKEAGDEACLSDLLTEAADIFAPYVGTRETVLAVGFMYGIHLFLSMHIAGWFRDQEVRVTYAGYCLIPYLVE